MRKKAGFLITALAILSCSSAHAETCFGDPSILLHSIFDTQNFGSPATGGAGALASAATAFTPLNASTLLLAAQGIFSALILFAVFSQFLEYLAGRLDLKGAIARILIVSALLAGYADQGNFRYVISDGLNDLGIWIRGGAGPTALLSQIGVIFSRTVGTDKGVGWLQGIGASFNTAARLILTVQGWITLLFITSCIATAVMSYVLDVSQILLLFLLNVLGPFCLVFAVLKSTQRIAIGWFMRWLEVSLWSVIYSAFMFAITIAYTSVIQIIPTRPFFNQIGSSLVPGKAELLGMFLGCVLSYVSIFILVSVPGMASSIVGARSGGFYNGVTSSIVFIPNLIWRTIKKS
jgi:hypothetical protein